MSTPAKELQTRALQSVSVRDFLQMELPVREHLLAPWLPTQGLAMIHAARGTGKTHLSLGIAYAVASGGRFLNWQAPQARGVLFIDGEMPAGVLQERLARLTSPAVEIQAPFQLITPDLQPFGIPDLGSLEGQRTIDQYVTDDIKLLVVDNLSCLVRSGKENEAESWQPVQSWALRHRARGRSVLFIHHSGKAGMQRGTSRREDVLDTVIALRRPVDYRPQDGAVFDVCFEKARGIYGGDVEPFEAKLTTDAHGRQTWVTRSVEDSTYERVIELLSEGLSQAEIARELNVNRSTVSRHAKRAKAEGKAR